MATDDRDWGWWAGRSDGEVSVGPMASKDDAIQEAVDQGDYEEVETPDGWRKLIHYAECCGEFYDCEECGTPPRPCDECSDYLSPDDLTTVFAGVRNAGHVLLEYSEDE